MARRSMSKLKERKLVLGIELGILEGISIEDFRTKEIQKSHLDKILRLKIRLEEVDLLLKEEDGKKFLKKKSPTLGAIDDRPLGLKDKATIDSEISEAAKSVEEHLNISSSDLSDKAMLEVEEPIQDGDPDTEQGTSEA